MTIIGSQTNKSETTSTQKEKIQVSKPKVGEEKKITPKTEEKNNG